MEGDDGFDPERSDDVMITGRDGIWDALFKGRTDPLASVSVRESGAGSEHPGEQRCVYLWFRAVSVAEFEL